jgi:hypothetical protein
MLLLAKKGLGENKLACFLNAYNANIIKQATHYLDFFATWK